MSVPDRRPAESMDSAKQIVLAVLVLIAAPLLVLGSVCRNNFTNWDDPLTIEQNPSLNPVTVNSLRSWWCQAPMDMYMPVTYCAWGAVALVAREPGTDATAPRLNPAPFHGMSLAVHVTCGLVVFALLRLLVGQVWPAALGALLFTLHPIQVEAVAWTSGLKDVLGGFLALAAVWQYLVAAQRQAGSRSRKWHYLLGLALCAAAMLAKPAEMTAPLIALALDWIVLRRSWKLTVRWLWPWFLLAAACAAETYFFQGVTGAANKNVAPYLRPVIALSSIAFYIGKIVWPTRLATDYGKTPLILLHDPWVTAKCLLVVLGGAVWWKLSRRTSLLRAAEAAFILPLLPVLGLVTFDFQSYSNVADHYLYVTMFGVALAAAWAIRRFSGVWVYGIAVAGLIPLGWLSHQQVPAWRDYQTLYRQELAVNPRSSTAYCAFARAAIIRRDFRAADQFARRAVELDGNSPNARVALALALWNEHRKSEAMEQFARALQLDPDNSDALQGMAQVKFDLGELDEAQDLIQHQLQIDPMSAEGHFDLGSILYHKGRLSQSVDELEQAVAYAPGRAQFRILLAKALAASGRRQEALRQLQAAQRLDPGSADARNGMLQLTIEK